VILLIGRAHIPCV